MRNPKLAIKIFAFTMALLLSYVLFLVITATFSHKIQYETAKTAFPDQYQRDIDRSIVESKLQDAIKDNVLKTYVECANNADNFPSKIINGFYKENVSCGLKAYEQSRLIGLNIDTTLIIEQWLNTKKFNSDTVMNACTSYKGLPCNTVRNLGR